MTRRYPPMPPDRRRQREPVFVEQEPVISHEHRDEMRR